VQQATISSLLPRYIDGGNKYLALSADGNTLALGNAIVNAQDTGSVSIYVRSGTNWQKQGPDLVGTGGINTGSGIEQGSTLALSADGNTLIEGGGADNGGTGAVWVFVRTDTTWSQQGAKLIGTGASSYGGGAGQGGAMAISADGNTLIEGGGADSNGMGAVWVFIRSGSTWTQQGGKIKATANPSDASSFGNSLAISADGNTALIGAFTDSGGIGSAYVYTRSSGIWTQQRRLVGSHSHTDNFMYQGYSVGLSADGNTAVLGGIEDSSAMGAVWAFTRSGTTWTQPGPKLVGSGVTWALPVFQGYLALSADGAMMIEIGSFEINDDGAMWTFGRNSCTDTTIYIAHAICQGDSFLFGTMHLTSAGTYTDTLINIGGCDSIITLTLTVYPQWFTNVPQNICQGDSFTFAGVVHYTGGTFSEILTSAHGCDSTVTLILTVNPLSYDSFSHTMCQGDSFTFGNRQLIVSGTYIDVLTSVTGCDSIVTLTLTVNPLPVVTLTWDSLVILGDLHVNLTDTFFFYDCSYQHTGPYNYLFNIVGGQPLGGIYSGSNVMGDSLNFFNGNINLSDTIYYTYTNGNGCSATASNSFGILYCVGIENISDAGLIHLYPNPNHGSFTLETSNSIGSEYTISDMLGDIIAHDVINANEQTIEVKDASEGVYTLVVKGSQPARFVVVR
jgi:hypothetical protein